MNTFTDIYKKNQWGGRESRSGRGSDSDYTVLVKEGVKDIVRNYGIKSIYDAGCGDFNWMKDIMGGLPGVGYLGVDVVEEAVRHNQKKYKLHNCAFRVGSILEKVIKVDLVICRDVLVHLMFKDVSKFLEMFRKSKAKYLLMTSFTGNRINKERFDGICEWCPINFQKEPFNLPEPLVIIREKFQWDEGNPYKDKSLLLWRRKDI